MAWSAFGAVPFSRHEVYDWWRFFGVPVFCWCWRVSWGDQGSLFQIEGASPVWCWIFFPLLAGVRPQDFPEPRLEAPQAEQALPPPNFPPELDPPVLPRNEVSPQPIADGAEGMDVDAGEVGEGPEPMTIDRVRVQKGKDLRRKKGMRGWITLFFKHRLMCGTRFVWKSLVVFSLLVRERTIHLLADFQQRQVSRRRTPALKAFHWASCNLNKVFSKVS